MTGVGLIAGVCIGASHYLTGDDYATHLRSDIPEDINRLKSMLISHSDVNINERCIKFISAYELWESSYRNRKKPILVSKIGGFSSACVAAGSLLFTKPITILIGGIVGMTASYCYYNYKTVANKSCTSHAKYYMEMIDYLERSIQFIKTIQSYPTAPPCEFSSDRPWNRQSDSSEPVWDYPYDPTDPRRAEMYIN